MSGHCIFYLDIKFNLLELAIMVRGSFDTPSFVGPFLKPSMKETPVGLLVAANESGQKMAHQFYLFM